MNSLVETVRHVATQSLAFISTEDGDDIEHLFITGQILNLKEINYVSLCYTLVVRGTNITYREKEKYLFLIK